MMPYREVTLMQDLCRLGELEAENARLKAELAEERARLDWLGKVGFQTVSNGMRNEREPGVHSWRVSQTMPWIWSAHFIAGSFCNVREAIDAARGRG